MHSHPDLMAHWRRVPITVLVLALSGVVFLLMEVLGEAVVLDWLAFNKVEYNGRRFELVSPGTDYWRYVSPALVHFGVMHIVFNALWIWEFGSRLELRLGSIFVLNLFLAGAVGGNLCSTGGRVRLFLAGYLASFTRTWAVSGYFGGFGRGLCPLQSHLFLPSCGSGYSSDLPMY